MTLKMLRHGQLRNEPIDMRERRYGYSPKVFRWRGHCYRVHTVERCWTLPNRRHRKGGRLYFLVRCTEGEFVVYQDLTAATWHVSDAKWHVKGESMSW